MNISETIPHDGLLTEVETAAYLGLKAPTLATWRCTQRYELPFVRVGRAIRYRRTDIEKFLANRTVGQSCADTEQRG